MGFAVLYAEPVFELGGRLRERRLQKLSAVLMGLPKERLRLLWEGDSTVTRLARIS